MENIKSRLEQNKNKVSKENKIEKTGEEKRAELILRYINEHIIKNNKDILDKNSDEIKEIEDYYAPMSAMEKANALYSSVMAYMTDRRMIKQKELKEKEQEKEVGEERPDEFLLSEIFVLSKDKDVRKLLPETYGKARIDKIKYRDRGNQEFWDDMWEEIRKGNTDISLENLEPGQIVFLWKEVKQQINEKEEEYKNVAKAYFLKQLDKASKIKGARTKLSVLAKNLNYLMKFKSRIEELQGFPKTKENTDMAAIFKFENLKEYKKQLDKDNFVWLPSRKNILTTIEEALMNGHIPFLIGESGTGKSHEAVVAGEEVTGHPPTQIACSRKTGKADLIEEQAISDEGESYYEYKPLMEAFTGYTNSLEKEPKYKEGRIVRLDEAGLLSEEAFAIIKEACQVRPGSIFHGREVLPGAGIIFTSNPVGARYPNRVEFDPAMQREVSEIIVDYPDMTLERNEKGKDKKFGPELFEFALATLFDENKHINVAEEEIIPAYEKNEIPEDEREILSDGSVVVAKDEIIEDMADKRHGALWRFCAAVKAVQDSFVYGNSSTEKYPDTLLRFVEIGDGDDDIEIKTDGSGSPLTLSKSTITLGDFTKWMQGFNARREKMEEEYWVETLTEWLNLKIESYIKQTKDLNDKRKIRAIFKYFHFLEDNIEDVKEAKPLTPKRIGYLSPLVPRSLYVKKPKKVEKKEAKQEEIKIETYETKEVMLENGDKIFIKAIPFEFEFKSSDDSENITDIVDLDQKFIFEKEIYFFAGVAEGNNSDYDGMLVAKIETEDLYKIFSSEEVDFGILQYQKELFNKNEESIEKQVLEYNEWYGCPSIK